MLQLHLRMSRPGGHSTPNNDIDVITNALRPLISGLQQRLDSISTQFQNNTVTARDDMLQTRLRDGLRTLRPEIATDIDQRLAPLINGASTLQNEVITTNQRVAELRGLLETARNDVLDGRDTINRHVAQVLVRACQCYNAGCGLGFTRPFRVVPVVEADGSLQLPNAFGLPLLLNTRMISNLTDHELKQYLQIYGIQVEGDGQDRRERLTQLRAHIGYVPPDSISSYGVAICSLLMGVFSYIFVLFVAAVVSGRGPWLLISL
ncbi:hypothetical protein EDD15DRAFT_2348991 [Pisolithus albus]|nr:hypothetical protein EDD15DRAFT_2348991 [Pisolithus albus]